MFTDMDLYQFYLECKQLPTYQLLQSAQKVVITDHWLRTRKELKACRIIQRLEYLKENGIFSKRTLLDATRIERPLLRRDLMLQEMRWIAKDLFEERRWRRSMAAAIAREACDYVTKKHHIQLIKRQVAVDRKRQLGEAFEAILGPPDPKRPFSGTANLIFYEPLVKRPAQTALVQLSHSPSSPKLKMPVSTTKVEDRLILCKEAIFYQLVLMFKSNWRIIAEAVSTIPQVSSLCHGESQCAGHYQLLLNSPYFPVISDPNFRISASNLSAIQHQSMRRYCALFSLIETAAKGSVVRNFVHRKSSTAATISTCHPSHDASIKQFSNSSTTPTVSELIYRRIHQTSTEGANRFGTANASSQMPYSALLSKTPVQRAHPGATAGGIHPPPSRSASVAQKRKRAPSSDLSAHSSDSSAPPPNNSLSGSEVYRTHLVLDEAGNVS